MIVLLQVVKFSHKFSAIEFYLGNPPQKFIAILRFSESDLIIVDEKCGRRDPDCPKYCDDRKNTNFSKIHINF